MALSIKDEKTDRLARELAAAKGVSITEAVTIALREELARMKHFKSRHATAEELDEIAKGFGRLPVYDTRTPDEILGYDENGLPT
jgi:antitoxin VapB